MRSHCCPPETLFEKIFHPIVREWCYSLLIWTGFLLAHGSSADVTRYVFGWVALAMTTGIARYVGGMTRRECRDLRFMWYSLHGKIPAWITWVFWLLMAVVLIRPLFAVSLYISVGMAFFRGYHFICACKACRTTLSLDLLVRVFAGFVI